MREKGRQAGAEARDRGDRTDWVSATPFIVAHLAPFAAFFVTVTWTDWVLFAALYVVRMFFVTAGYHRYFSHRSFKTSRVAQFVLAVGATTSMQKGPLWWAGHHRLHHRFTDVDGDVHSPRDGFWWSHVGWILSRGTKRTDLDAVRDFAAVPELRLLDRFHLVPPVVLAAVCWVVGGPGGLLVGFFASTVVLWHATFAVNSLAHLTGRRRFATADTSRNSWPIALLAGGEGWHNNHHYLPSSVRQGLTWWEVDTTWYALRALAALHLVRDLRRPPERLLHQARLRDGAFDIGMFRAYWERAARVAGERLVGATGGSLPAGADGMTGSGPPGAREGTETDGTGSPPLSWLIARALESADQLARSTRRYPVSTVATTAPGEPG